MIFVTVGAQLPFDRLIQTVDAWAEAKQYSDIFAQIGNSTYQARWLQTRAFLTPLEFKNNLHKADLIVAHAGMGSIISAMEYRKPLLVMPRRAALGETRNDHQIDTVKRFAVGRGIYVAYDEKELVQQMDILLHEPNKQVPVAGTVAPELIAVLRNFIEDKGQEQIKF